MGEFDSVVKKKFDELQSSGPTMKGRLQGHCKDYNNCDDIWKFVLSSCEIKSDTYHLMSKNVLLVTMPADMSQMQTKQA